ncbi:MULTISPECIES: hypothetical protein [unclassified Saccharothrix]|uniref:hypothetical protein n=1 Tax=unclassified Saccharothrix TaxID=2593673 RepID=UPI00307E3AC5
MPHSLALVPTGTVGGSVSASHGGTVTVTVGLAGETLPAASRALTYKPRTAPGTTVRSADVPATEVMCCPSW